MVAYDNTDELIQVDGEEEDVQKEQEVLFEKKWTKVHIRPIIDAFFTRDNNGTIGFVTVGHDALKVWLVEESSEGCLELTEIVKASKWRCGVQSADVSRDGNEMIVIGNDSLVHEVMIQADPEVSSSDHTVTTHDFGYMEAWCVKITPDLSGFITTSFSGYLTEIGNDGKIVRKVEFPNVKNISCIAYSSNGQWFAVANVEGVVKLLDSNSLKEISSFEVHSMKIRALTFAPDDSFFVTGADDRTIKLHAVNGDKPTVMRVMCGHRSPITCISIDSRSNGQRMASGSSCGEVLIWNIDKLTPLYRLSIGEGKVHESIIGAVRFHPNGRHIVSVGEDRQIIVFKIPQSGQRTPQREEKHEDDNCVPNVSDDEGMNNQKDDKMDTSGQIDG